jgi:hypothetical protein
MNFFRLIFLHVKYKEWCFRLTVLVKQGLALSVVCSLLIFTLVTDFILHTHARTRMRMHTHTCQMFDFGKCSECFSAHCVLFPPSPMCGSPKCMHCVEFFTQHTNIYITLVGNWFWKLLLPLDPCVMWPSERATQCEHASWMVMDHWCK